MSCSTCKFWKPQQAHFGLCRRRSPGLTQQGGTKWPTTVGHDVCGDHEEHPLASVREFVVPKQRTDRDPIDPALEREQDRLLRKVGIKGSALREFLDGERPPAVLTQEVTLPPGWLSEAVRRALGVRCGHQSGFEVQISVGGVPHCPDCNEPQSGVRA